MRVSTFALSSAFALCAASASAQSHHHRRRGVASTPPSASASPSPSAAPAAAASSEAPATAASASAAPSTGNAAAALAAYNHGVELYDHHDFQNALTSFRESYQQVPSPNSRLYIARTLRELGDLAQATTEYQGTLDDATERARREPRYAGTRDAARDELRELGTRAGRVRIDVSNIPEGARIRVDGRDVGRAALAQPLPVSPGHISVAVEANGYQPFTQTVEVAAGAEATVPVTLERATAVATTGPSVTPSTRSTFEFAPMPRNLALVGAGLGVLGMVGFISFGVAANSTWGDLQQRCGTAPCVDPANRNLAASGRTYDTLANVSLGIGIAGFVAGAALLYWSYRSGTRHEVTVGTTGTSLTIGGRF